MMPRPTKIVRIIARMNVGGPSRHCVILGQGLAERGFETLLLAGDLDAGETPYAVEQGPRFRVEHVPGLGRPPSPRDDLRALRWLVRTLRRERPDIVHTHTAKAGALGRLAARMAGVPVIVHTFHGHVLSGYFGPLGNLAVRVAEQGLARITQRLVTLSPRLRDELVERYRIGTREQFEIIPLGRDLESLRDLHAIRAGERLGVLHQELDLPADAFIVGCVGRLVPIKDVSALVEAFARLAATHPLAHLVIVGDGADRPQIEALVAERRLGGHVHLLGWRHDLPAIYADLDLLALSSRNEGTPLAIIEAFAAGAPVVATSVGGVPDMFDPPSEGDVFEGAAPPGVRLRAQGALVPPGDPVALGDALRFFADHPALREAAGAAALEGSKRWSARRLVDDMEALYRRLLAEARP